MTPRRSTVRLSPSSRRCRSRRFAKPTRSPNTEPVERSSWSSNERRCAGWSSAEPRFDVRAGACSPLAQPAPLGAQSSGAVRTQTSRFVGCDPAGAARAQVPRALRSRSDPEPGGARGTDWNHHMPDLPRARFRYSRHGRQPLTTALRCRSGLRLKRRQLVPMRNGCWVTSRRTIASRPGGGRASDSSSGFLLTERG